MTYLSKSIEKASPFRTNREHVGDLLVRYPAISTVEAQQIIRFLKTGRHLDIGLLTSDERLRRNLDAFMKEYQAHFRVKWHEAAAVTAIFIGILAALWFMGVALS